MKCSQCDRDAMYEVKGHLLCLEHFTMMSNNLRQSQIQGMAMINYFSDNIDSIFGLPPRGPRISLPPQTVVNNNPTTNNNIKVDRSFVSSINTGQVARINAAMSNIQNGGNEEVSSAIKSLTESVINNKEIESRQKEEIIEQLTFLAEQATLPKSQQQTSVIKMVLKTVPATLSTLTSLNTLWTQWGRVIEGFFKH